MLAGNIKSCHDLLSVEFDSIIYLGLVIFSILGSLAHELGVPVKAVVDSGPGLAFVSYPSALAKFDVVPQLFSVLFFLMLITLGLGSATGLTTGIITVFCDLYPDKNKVRVCNRV